jgi:hypothetical protein
MRPLPKAASRLPRALPRLEVLEDRITPYAISGDAWPYPIKVTISFVPDGTLLGYNGDGSARTSNLFATFNSLFGSTTTWQTQILKAAQVWAQATNINFSVVADNGAATGSNGNQQGDPNFGDIRIGGYNDGPGAELGYAYMPPPDNNYSIAGDVVLNTGQPWNIGSTYDVFTVAAHEIGHALGMLHSTDSMAVMYSSYPGTMTGLSSDDASGIEAIYSGGAPRSPDPYDAVAPGGSNGSFTTATTVAVNPTSKTALLTGADITTTSDVDFYKFTAPTGSAARASVQVTSNGLSLLAPNVYIYNSLHILVGYGSGTGHYGTTVTASASITAGSTYYVKVMSADTSPFGTGAYALTINTGTGANPTVPLPNTAVAAGSPEQTSGGVLEVGSNARAGSDPFFPSGDPTTVTPVKVEVVIRLGTSGVVSMSPIAQRPTTVPVDVLFASLPAQQTNTIPLLPASLTALSGGNDVGITDDLFEGDDLLVLRWFTAPSGE